MAQSALGNTQPQQKGISFATSLPSRGFEMLLHASPRSRLRYKGTLLAN